MYLQLICRGPVCFLFMSILMLFIRVHTIYRYIRYMFSWDYDEQEDPFEGITNVDAALNPHVSWWHSLKFGCRSLLRLKTYQNLLKYRLYGYDMIWLYVNIFYLVYYDWISSICCGSWPILYIYAFWFLDSLCGTWGMLIHPLCWLNQQNPNLHN